MYVPPSQAAGKKRGRGWTRTIDPLINISRSLLSYSPKTFIYKV